MFEMDLEKFARGKIFLSLRVLSRVFLLLFGLFLFIDDLLWHNIGGATSLTGMAPTVGVIKTYEIAGIHIHHAYIGFILMLMAAISLICIYIERTK